MTLYILVDKKPVPVESAEEVSDWLRLMEAAQDIDPRIVARTILTPKFEEDGKSLLVSTVFRCWGEERFGNGHPYLFETSIWPEISFYEPRFVFQTWAEAEDYHMTVLERLRKTHTAQFEAFAEFAK